MKYHVYSSAIYGKIQDMNILRGFCTAVLLVGGLFSHYYCNTSDKLLWKYHFSMYNIYINTIIIIYMYMNVLFNE